MAQGGGAPPEWDSEWVYTDGFPTVKGWELTTTGGTNSMTSTGLKLIGNRYIWSSGATNGIIEAKFQIASASSSMTLTRAVLRIGDSANAVSVIFRSYSGSHRIRLYDNSTQQSGTNLGAFTLGSWYVVRLEINGSTGKVIINGDVAAENVDTARMYSKGVPQFGAYDSYGGSVWEYVKMKVS